jgi:LPPG:FO 2-phospho-L-lactate transferase
MRQAGLETALLPATDDPLRTFVATSAGTFGFQEWFVTRGHADDVDAMLYEGADAARAAPGVIDALLAADAIVLAPSNPYTSIHPILAVATIHATLEERRAPVIAVSPLIGGLAVRGPLDRMLTRMAGGTTPAHVAACYQGLIDGLVIDHADAPASAEVPLHVTDTLITGREPARRLAETVLEVASA